LLHELGVTPAALDRLRKSPFQEAQRSLEALKVEARRRYRRLAGKYHPDRNPDQQEQAQQDFVLLGRVLQDIEKLRVQPAQPVRRPIMQVHFATTASTTSSTTTSTSFSYFQTAGRPTPSQVYNARRVIIMRPF